MTTGIKPMGHNLLGGTVRKMCENAGLQGHYTNHSLRATAATTLFEAGTDMSSLCNVQVTQPLLEFALTKGLERS